MIGFGKYLLTDEQRADWEEKIRQKKAEAKKKAEEKLKRVS